MRILMLGNSFTFFNDMPEMLAKITKAEVIVHTRGGARLAEQYNPLTQMGACTLKALTEEKWDYVVMQEMSNAPIVSRHSFLKSVSILSNKIRQSGAVPVLYATWAYRKNSNKMNSMKCSYDEMYQLMYIAYHEAAVENNALVVDVGKAFYALSDKKNLYTDDGCHPNEEGSKLAARLLAEVMLNSEKP